MVEAMTMEIVTFDIFDTLLHRKVMAPVDVFELVKFKAFEDERSLSNHDSLVNYVYDRMEAEKLSRERRVADHGGEGEVVLDEIYAEYRLLTGCKPEIAEFLRSLELDIERHVLVASPRGKALYDLYRDAGRTIAFLSDMYLPSEWLKETLERQGFIDAGRYTLLVSGEHRVSKHSGQLYTVAQTILGVSDPARWLHIGDNRHADIERARSMGIQTLHADWSAVANNFVPTPGLGATQLVSSIISFIESRQSAQYVPQDPMESFGYRIFGPLLFGFTLWLFNYSKESKLRHMIFVARDGWLIKHLFDQYKSAVGLAETETKYVYLSRKVAYKAGLREWDAHLSWYLVAAKTSRSVAKAFAGASVKARRFLGHLSNFGMHDVETQVPADRLWSVKLALDTFAANALAASQTYRHTYRSYFDLLPEGKESIGFVDIGWTGNIQRTFLHALEDASVQSRVQGLYLGTLWSSQVAVSKGLRMKGWICDGGAPNHWEHLLINGGVELLEFVLTADHGSAMGLQRDEDGTIVPVLEELSSSEAPYREKAMRAQAGVKKFFEDYAFLFSLYEPGTLATTAWMKPFERLVSQPNELELRELASLTHSEAPGANDIRLPLASRQPFRIRRRKKYLEKAREMSFWKAAFDKLNK